LFYIFLSIEIVSCFLCANPYHCIFLVGLLMSMGYNTNTVLWPDDCLMQVFLSLHNFFLHVSLRQQGVAMHNVLYGTNSVPHKKLSFLDIFLPVSLRQQGVEKNMYPTVRYKQCSVQEAVDY
jgi:hypothetical protein